MNPYSGKLEVSVRAIIESKGRILVCQNKKKGYYFFPGGHLKFGERPIEALQRELKEELGISFRKFSFMGIVDNIFTEDNKKHHEFVLSFSIKFKNIHNKSREDHINFEFLSKKDFIKTKVYPLALKKATLTWFKNKKTFWASQ